MSEGVPIQPKVKRRVEDGEEAELGGVVPGPPSRLRARIMTSGYKYRLLDDQAYVSPVGE